MLSACAKEENCRDATVGIYAETIPPNNPAISPGIIFLDLKAANGNQEVLIHFEFEDANGDLRGTIAILEGTLGDNCNVLEIPTQTYNNETYSGTFSTQDHQLKGFLVSSGTTVNLNLVKQ